MRLRLLLNILILALCAACIPECVDGSSGAGAESTPAKGRMLQRLRASKTPQKDAAAAAKTSPGPAAELCLDAIFYHWTNVELGATTDIPNLNAVVQGLSTVASPAVEWARFVLTQPGTDYGRPAHSPTRGETIDTLNAARKSVREAATSRNASPVRTVASLTAAHGVLDKLGLQLSAAAVLRERGNQRASMGQYRLAEEDYEQAWITFSGYSCEGKVAELHEDVGSLTMELSRFNEAHRNFLSAAHAWLSLGQGNKACRQFVRAGQALAAMGRQEQALATMLHGRDEGHRWAIANKSYRMLVEDLLEIAAFLAECDDRAGLRDVLLDAHKWAGFSGDLRLQSTVLAALGPAWLAVDRQQEAEECARKRLEILKKAAAPGVAAARNLGNGANITVAERNKLIADLNTAAWAVSEMDDPREGAGLYEQAAVLCLKAGRRADEAQALWNGAKAYQLARQPGRASQMLRAAADSALAAGQDSVAAHILVELSEACLPADPAAALKALQDASKAAHAAGNQKDYSLVQHRRAKLLAQQKEHAEAAVHLSDAAQRYLANVGEPWIFSAMSLDLADIYRAIREAQGGRVEQAEKEIAALAEAENRAYAWCEYEGLLASNDPERASLLAAIYSKLIPLEVNAGKQDAAADHLRRAYLRGALPAVLDRVAASGDVEAAAFVEKFRAAHREPSEEPTTAGLVAQGWPAVLGFSWQLAQNQPRFSESVVISIAEIAKQRSRLPDDVAIVEYMIGDSASYAFVLGRNNAYCRQINAGRAKVDADIRALRTILTRAEERVRDGIPVAPVKSWQDAHVREIIEVLESLGSILVAPILGELKFARTLAFAPPSDLAGAPFHAFGWQSDGGVRFLVQDFAVAYVTPMMFADLVGQQRPVRNGAGRVVVFADPLQNLPGAVDEAAAIKSAYTESDLFVGRAATREQFRKSAATASALHIAAHHKLEGSPGRFSIELAAGPAGAGSIGVEELCEVANPALALVVLSACETASSTNPTLSGAARAAEVVSLTGAPTVIGALWKVSDKGTIELMGEMYRELAKGTSKAGALRQAQNAMIRSGRFAHPYYWAGFALFGSPD